MAWFVQLLIGLVLKIIAYLIMPKPKVDQPAEVKDMNDPTAEAGRPVPVVFGSITVKGLNIIWYGEKRRLMVPKDSGGKK